jgi:hypothetical protein
MPISLHILIAFSIKRSLTSWWKSCALSPYILAPSVFLSPLAGSSNLISVLSELRRNLEQPPFGSSSGRNKSRESTAVQSTLDSTTTFSSINDLFPPCPHWLDGRYKIFNFIQFDVVLQLLAIP